MRVHKLRRTLCSLAALGIAAGLPLAAQAQTQPDLALSRFHPAPAGDRMFGVQSPYVAGHFDVHAMLLGDYARKPFVLRYENEDEPVGAVVQDQLLLHLSATLALWNRVQLNVAAPIALLNAGDDPSGGGLAFTSPSGVAFGDLRLGLRVRLLGDYHDMFQLGVGGYVWVPTGAAGSYLSDKSVRGLPQLIAGGRGDRLVWSLAAGPEIRQGQTVANVQQGLTLAWGGGVGLLLGGDRALQIGPEFSASTVLEDANKRTTNAEVLLGARYRFLSFMEAGLAGGPGLTSGIGTPQFRALAMLAFTPEQKKAEAPTDRDKDGIVDNDDACVDVPGVASDDPAKNGCPPPNDRDKDGVIDEQDACVDVPGVKSDDPKKNGCPLPKDRDKDGIVDEQDACPDLAGVQDPDPKKNGCPPDKDGDGVFDAQDACIDIPGVKTSDPATNGCPGDNDGDTIRNDKDACPNEKGKPNADPTKNGCPLAVRVTEKEIIILQQVQFDTSKATIKAVSNPLLDEVGAVLAEHPEITKIEVQGHTDSTGSRQLNTKLSQARAESVKAALVKRGIDAARLDPKGYGPDEPIADNKTAEGRQQNRRVQFKIVEKKAK